MRRILIGLVLAAFGAAAALSPSADAQEKKKKAGPKSHAELVDSGIDFLKSSQAADGTWSKSTSPGITGLTLYGLFRTGKVTPADPVASKALKVVEGMIDAKDGNIAAGEGKIFHKNYITSVNVLALQASGEKKYASAVAGGAKFLKDLQWDESEEKTPKDPYYGGTGYGPGTRPDLSNTHFFIDAIKTAGIPASDPAYKKAIVFISRCQNLKGETNDQPWAGKIDDGSFIYVLVAPKGSKAPDDAPRPGYGSMTAAGLKSLLYCGLSQEDPRVKKATQWFKKHYTVDSNPGMPAGSGTRGYYYYLVVLAKCMDALGSDTFVDDAGNKHDWRADITAALANRQRKDGSWSNETAGWQEGNPDLCTAYALIALSYTRPKTK